MTLCLNDLAIYKPDGEVLLSNFNLTIKPGQITCLMGPSGCGKSSLLNVIAGHVSEGFRYQGKVQLDDQEIGNMDAHLRRVGILFQDDLLFPHLTVWQNLAFALPNEIKGEARKRRAIEALTEVSLNELANSYPERISGGQRARISLLRMLLAKPKLALLDEPFSKLDATLRSQFREWVFLQLQQAHIPALLVTHDAHDAPNGGEIIQWPQN